MTAYCPDCGATWAGRRQHCRGGKHLGCCMTFNSTSAGDMHRVGEFGVDRRCLTPVEMLERGMTRHNGIWYGPRKNADPRPRGTTQGGEHRPAQGAVPLPREGAL